MLSEQQVNHFNTFGFLIFRQLFSPEEMKTINAEFEHALTSAYRHAPLMVRIDIGCGRWA